jgi:hypothetical protein
LVGCWQMEEGSGSAIYDGSLVGNNGTTTGVWESGKTGTYALSLDGSTQSASVPDDDSLDLTTAFTIAGWIKPGKSGTQDLFKKADMGVTDGYEVTLGSSGKVFFRINQDTNSDTYRIDSTTLYPTGGDTWMHVAATYSGGTMRLYIDGYQEGGDLADAPAPAVNTLPFTLGTQATSPRPYQGAMDDVRLYDRALSEDEIQTLAWMKPVVTDIPGQTVAEGASFVTINLDNYVSDANNTDAEMTWLSSGETDLIVNIVDRVATLTPLDPDWNGSNTITFRATDPDDFWDEDAATFTVTAVNDAPVLGAIGPKGTAELVPLMFIATATDIDVPANTLTYSLANGDDGSIPVGAGIGSTSGGFSWTPTEAQGPGIFTFDVCVRDGSLSDCETISVTVSEAAISPNAVPDAYDVMENDTLMVPAPGVLANDSDVDIPANTLTAVLDTSTTNGSLILNEDGLFVYVPDTMWSGIDTFTYKVYDGTGYSEVVSVTITVNLVKLYLPMIILPFDKPVLTLIKGPVLGSYTLSWKPIDGANDYKIWESLSSTFPTDPTYVSGGSTSFTLPDLNPTRYYYYMVATNGSRDTLPSNTLTVDRQYKLEPNDSGETANGPIFSGITYYGQTNDLRDYYKIRMDSPGTITVTMTSYPSSWRGQLQLFEEDTGNIRDSDVSPGNGMVVTWTGEKANWYYILIGTDPASWSSDWYTFTVTFTP